MNNFLYPSFSFRLNRLKKNRAIGVGHTVWYYVSAIGNWESSFNTNTVDYLIQGEYPEKAAGKFSPDYSYGMEQNHPNPFNPITIISFSLPEKQRVKIKVYDITGREVKILADSEYDAGIHNVEFNGTELSS